MSAILLTFTSEKMVTMTIFWSKMDFFICKFKIRGPKWWNVSTSNNKGNLYGKNSMQTCEGELINNAKYVWAMLLSFVLNNQQIIFFWTKLNKQKMCFDTFFYECQNPWNTLYRYVNNGTKKINRIFLLMIFVFANYYTIYINGLFKLKPSYCNTNTMKNWFHPSSHKYRSPRLPLFNILLCRTSTVWWW